MLDVHGVTGSSPVSSTISRRAVSIMSSPFTLFFGSESAV